MICTVKNCKLTFSTSLVALPAFGSDMRCALYAIVGMILLQKKAKYWTKDLLKGKSSGRLDKCIDMSDYSFEIINEIS